MHPLVKQILTDFKWADYGLDEMVMTPSDQWADDLADEVIDALRADGYL